MSLIPSESLNFPDSFRANVGWRLAEETDENGPAKQQVPVAAWPQPATTPAGSEQGATADPQASPTSAKTEPGKDDAQPGLQSQAPVEGESMMSAPGTAEMTALLRHFLSAAAKTEPSISEAPTPSPGLSPAPPEATNGQHDSAVNEAGAPNDAVSSPAMPSPNRTEIVPDPAPALVTPATQVAGSSPDAPQSKPAPPAVLPLAPEERPVEAVPTVAGSIAVESPAQAQHILEMIAAAVQRGKLAGKVAPSAAEAAVVQPPSQPEEQKSEAGPPPPSPLGPVGTAAIEPAAPVTHSPEVKTPAKIRITPRKIKPRPIAQPVPEPAATGDDFAAEQPEPAHRQHVAEHKPEKPGISPPTEFSFLPQPSIAGPTGEELAGRRIAAARQQFAQTDLLLFAARERRNRWIGFGFSELAVLTALVLLGRYGFTHHFPDPTVKLLVFILIFAAAAVAVALPIAFFRNSPERWGREK